MLGGLGDRLIRWRARPSGEVPGRVGVLGQPGCACQFPGWKTEPWTTLPGCTRHRNVLDSRPLRVPSWTCCQLRKQLLCRVMAQNALFGKEGRLRQQALQSQGAYTCLPTPLYLCGGGMPGCLACRHSRPLWLLIGPAMSAGMPLAGVDDWQGSERAN